MTPLRALIDAVKAGTFPDMGPLEAMFPQVVPQDIYNAFSGSTDAALQFIATMLPAGCVWEVSNNLGARIWLDPEDGFIAESDNPDPARALLICALEAIEWQRAQEGGV